MPGISTLPIKLGFESSGSGGSNLDFFVINMLPCVVVETSGSSSL